MKLNEYLNMIYVESRRVNFPATVTNIRSQVAKELVEDLIKEYERWEMCRLEFVSKVSYMLDRQYDNERNGHNLIQIAVLALAFMRKENRSVTSDYISTKIHFPGASSLETFSQPK